jgi:hypothetical protein
MRPAGSPWDAPRWQYRGLAVAAVVLGLALFTSELGLLPVELARPVAVAAPVALMVAGAALVLRGWPGAQKSGPAFAVERGQAARGELAAVVGGQDLTLCAFAGQSQLAVGEFPNRQGPRVEVEATLTRLTLTPQMVVPYLGGGPWNLAVTKSVPWTLNVRADGGHLDLNLRDLTIEQLKVHSAYGKVCLTLPTQAPAELQLRLALGDLFITVPEGAEVKLRLSAGSLVNTQVDERRFIQVAPNEWMTPLYLTTTQRCTVLVDMTAGELKIT